MALWAVCLLLAVCSGGSHAARPHAERGNIDAQVPPKWPDAYEMEYTLILPYVQTMQPGGLQYPVHVWWDGPSRRYRMDVYGGMDSTGYDYSQEGQGLSWNLYPRISELECDTSNATVGPTAAAAAAALLAGGLREGGSSTPLPDISGWSYAGTTTLGNSAATVWQLSERHGEKTATYSFYTAPNGWPLRFYMMGVNVLTGSHFDEYVIEFSRFRPGTPPDRAFQPPGPCKAKAEAKAKAAAGAGGSAGRDTGLATRLGLLLPSAGLPATSASSAALSALRSASASAVAENARLVETHNARADAAANSNANTAAAAAAASAPSYRLSLNHFSHLSHDQWAAGMLGLAPAHQRATWRDKRRAAALGASSSGAEAGTAAVPTYVRVLSDDDLPPSVDWRGSGADGPGVKDQVSCGSCWAFSAVGAMQGAWFKATGQSLSLSEQQLVDCSWDYENNGCAGGWVEPAIQYVVDAGGVAQEADYPYLGQNGYCRGPTSSPSSTSLSSSSAAASAAAATAPLAAAFSGFVNVPPRDERALMEAVALHGPVAVVLNAGLPPFKFYSEGVYHNEHCKEDPDHMDHAVLLVGYGTTPEGVDYWLIKNSWSKYWGMDGYARITRKGNDCGITTDPVVALVNATAAARAVRSAAAAAVSAS